MGFNVHVVSFHDIRLRPYARIRPVLAQLARNLSSAAEPDRGDGWRAPHTRYLVLGTFAFIALAGVAGWAMVHGQFSGL